VGRGQPVGPLLATSSDGGGIAADPIAARPVQVLAPCVLVFSIAGRRWKSHAMGPTLGSAMFRCHPAIATRVMFPAIGPIGGLAMPATVTAPAFEP